MKQRRKCPIHGCQGMREAGQPLCNAHWQGLPPVLRDRLGRLMTAAPRSDALKQALREARGLTNLHVRSRQRQAERGPVEWWFAS